MFGLAVWDGASRRAVLARDRLGIKPLYYAVCGDVLVFASELKSLLASGLVDGELDYEAIDAFLTLGFFPTPATPLAGVSKLPPGHRLVVERGKVRIESYWSYPAPTVSPRVGEPGGVGRAAPRGARRVRPASSDERRSARRDAERRPRLEPDRRPDGAEHDRAGEDVLRRVRGGRGRQRAARRSARRRASRVRPPRARALVRTRTRWTSGISSGTWTSRLPTSRRSGSSHSRSSPRNTSQSPCRARARTSSSGATTSIVRRHSLGGGDAHLGLFAALSSSARPPWSGSDPASRQDARGRRSGDALARDERQHRSRASAPARPRAARGARRPGRAPRDRRLPRRGSGRSAAGHALPRRAAWPRRRHAPLLRSCIDGPLARGSRPVPRPPRRRVRRREFPRDRRSRERRRRRSSSEPRAASCPTASSTSPRSVSSMVRSQAGSRLRQTGRLRTGC